MRVGTKDGGDGVRCWNKEAVLAYADQVNAREAQLARGNPDVVVLPGQLVCYGCEVMDYDYGVKCTASLTLTRYAVEGEIPPRAEDAVGSLAEVAGLRHRAPEEIAAQVKSSDLTSAPSAPAAATAGSAAASAGSSVAAPPQEGRRSGLRGLFGR